MKKQTQLLLSEDHSDKSEIISLNENLFNEFTVDELEVRLETDPLLLSNLFSLGADDVASTYGDCGCKKIGNCPHLECGCNGNTPPPPAPCSCKGVNIEADLDLDL